MPIVYLYSLMFSTGLAYILGTVLYQLCGFQVSPPLGVFPHLLTGSFLEQKYPTVVTLTCPVVFVAHVRGISLRTFVSPVCAGGFI